MFLGRSKHVSQASCYEILTPSAEVLKQRGLKRELGPGRIISEEVNTALTKWLLTTSDSPLIPLFPGFCSLLPQAPTRFFSMLSDSQKNLSKSQTSEVACLRLSTSNTVRGLLSLLLLLFSYTLHPYHSLPSLCSLVHSPILPILRSSSPSFSFRKKEGFPGILSKLHSNL